MKSILKLSVLAILLTTTSCAHHRKCDSHKGKSQCAMKEGKKECCSDKEQCPMTKSEGTSDDKVEESKK